MSDSHSASSHSASSDSTSSSSTSSSSTSSDSTSSGPVSSRLAPEPQPDPFAPIETEPTSPAVETGVPTGHRVYLTGTGGEEDQIHAGTVPAHKLLLSNREIRSAAQQITGQSPWTWAPAMAFFDGRCLAYGLAAGDLSLEVGAEETLSLGLLFQNSYDGRWAPGMQLFAYYRPSATGLLHPRHFGKAQLLAQPQGAGWSTDLRRFQQYLDTAEEKAQRFTARCEDLRRETVSASDLADLRRGPLAQWPTGLWGRLLDQYLGGTSRTAWDLLTRGSALLWNENDRPRGARDFRHNQALTEGIVGSVPEDTGDE